LWESFYTHICAGDVGRIQVVSCILIKELVYAHNL
jgi:hypothetical protein